MRVPVRHLLAVLAFSLTPTLAFAQASIHGVVKDSSGALLPGVTVEASSLALIEKVRSAVTDGSGQYDIPGLRPGTYAVTYSLSGFTTVKREGLELAGTFTATVNVEMKVGSLAETITVTGETPVVDVVNARQQAVVSNETLSAIPTARLYHSIATLIPGVSVSGTQDVGGIAGPTTVTFSMRGGPGNEGRLTVDGMSLGASLNGTGVSYTVADVGNAQEIVFNTAGQLGEAEVGGPSMNLVPRQGGNRFSGAFFANGANDQFASSNYTDSLKAQGLPAPTSLLKIWDTNAAIGGPIRKDRLWFFSAVRYQGNRKTAPNFVNANADDPTKWTYVPSATQGTDDGTWKNVNARFTLQATPRNKFNFFWDEQRLCTSCISSSQSVTNAPEAHYNNHAPPRVQQVTWSSPVTNKLLLEAGWGANLIDGYGTRPNVSNYRQLIPVVEACTAGCAANGGIPGLAYRSTAVVPFVGSYTADSDVWNWRASATLATGRSTFKAGYLGTQIVNHFATVTMNDQALSYGFNNGAPATFIQWGLPAMQNTHVQVHAFYAQDSYTLSRLTLSGALRYDHTGSFFPQQTVGPNAWVPTAVVVPQADGTHYNDLTPRAAAVYDVFGDGKTAVKFNAGKYLAAADGSSITGGLTNPLALFQTNSSPNGTSASGGRSWTDSNGNFQVDCAVNGVIPITAVDARASGGDACGAGNPNFLNFNTRTTTYAPAILSGWGVRPYDWNFGVQVQQQLHARVSVDVGYFRRIFGNFSVTNNRAQTNFGQFQITAPTDSRLPGGGGQTIAGLYNVDQTQFGTTNNLVNLADNLDVEQRQHWNGVEVNFTARMREGLTFQGGTSTGRTSTDSCAVRAAFPATTPTNPYCHVDNPFLTQVKGLVSYVVPKVDVVVSSAFQSIPGANLAANYTVPAATIAASLGRTPTGFSTVNLVAPGTLQGDRVNQVDLRAGKVLKFGRLRTQFSVDLYNVLNTSAVQTYNQVYIPTATSGSSAWLAPQAILPARFAKLTAQIDF
ncbi:MAG: TonB-dependent receptor [Acidobacteriota bacterium]